MNIITTEAYEGDIVLRLRNWRGLHLAHGGQLFEEAAAEIERLRALADKRGSIAVKRRREIQRLRLTDAEREAVEIAADACGNCNGFGGDPRRPALYEGNRIAATLRGLLERMT